MEYNDITKECIDCGRTFTWPAKDQQFLHELVGAPPTNGFSPVKEAIPPKRCKACRIKRKALFTKD